MDVSELFFFLSKINCEWGHKKYFDKGFDLSKLKRYEEAIEQYKLAIQDETSYSSAYNNMGVALNELKRYEEAIEQYKLALQYNPSHSTAYYNMGNSLDELKRYEEAIEQFKLAIRYNPSNSTAFYSMGVALRKLKRYKEAIEQYKLAIQYNPSFSDAYYNMGLVLYALRRDEEAIEQFKLAIQYEPSHPYAYYNMGLALVELNRYEESIEHYKRAIEYNPSNSDAYYNMGVALYELRRYKEAIEQYKLAIQYEPSFPYAYYNMGLALYELNRYKESIEQYKLAIQYNPSNSYAYYNMGFVLRKLNRDEEAIEQFKLAIQYNPSFSDAYYNMGFTLYELKRYEEAIEQYKLALQYNPSDSYSYNNMGLASYKIKRYEESIEQFKLAIQYNPSHSTAYNNMGRSLNELKRYEEAMEQYNLSIQYNPSFSDTYYNKGRVLMIMGRYDEAEEEYNHSIEQLSQSLSSSILDDEFYELNKVNIGWIKIKRKDFQSANQIFTFELKNQLSTYEGMLINAILLYKQGKYPYAHYLLNNIDITCLQELNNYYYYYMAMCLWKSMKNDIKNEEEEERRIIIIIKWLNKAIENDKEWVKPYYRRAQLLSHLQSSSSPDEVVFSSKFQFIIQLNQQNAPFYQLSLSKITSLLTFLQKGEKKEEEQEEIQKENKQQENIIPMDAGGIINVEYIGEISPEEKTEEHIHIDAEGIKEVEYKGVVELIKGYLPAHSCDYYILSDLPQVLNGISNHIPRIVNESILIAEDRIQRRIKEGGIILSKDEAIAIASYTFDLGYHATDKSGNLYQILNNVLRERNSDKMRKLQAYLYYLMNALSKLNAVNGIVYRGIPPSHKKTVEDHYQLGSKIHWSAFTSTTPSLERAKIFAKESGIEEVERNSGGILFRIQCLTGRSIRDYSSFLREDEVLLSPNCCLIVTKEICLEADGYYYVDLLEIRKTVDGLIQINIF